MTFESIMRTGKVKEDFLSTVKDRDYASMFEFEIGGLVLVFRLQRGLMNQHALNIER